MRERQAACTVSLRGLIDYIKKWLASTALFLMVLFSIKKNHEIRGNVSPDQAFNLYPTKVENSKLHDPREHAYYVCGHLWWDPRQTCESGATSANHKTCWIMLLSWVRKFFIPNHESPVFCQCLWNNKRLPFRLYVVKQFKTLQSSWHGYYTYWIITTTLCGTIRHR